MNIQLKALCALAFALLITNQANADILALYEFDPNAAGQPQSFVDGAGNERAVSRDLNPDVTAQATTPEPIDFQLTALAESRVSLTFMRLCEVQALRTTID